MIEFRTRFTTWALSDLQREAHSGFALLRKINGYTVGRLLHRLDMLSAREQLEYMEILLLHKHQSPLLAASPYRDRAEWVLRDYESVQQPMGFEPWLKCYPGPGEKQAKRRKVASAIIREAASLIGAQTWANSGEFRFERPIGRDLVLRTHIDVGGNFHALGYDHTILGGGENISDWNVSFLTWLGISGATHWKYVLDSDVDDLAAGVKEMMSLYINALPSLLGLPLPVQK